MATLLGISQKSRNDSEMTILTQDTWAYMLCISISSPQKAECREESRVMRKVSPVLVLAVLLVLGLPLWALGDEGKVTSDEVKKQAGEAFDAAKKYAGQQKADYQQKIEQELAELGDNIVKLKERAKTATGESLKALEERIGDLRERQAAAQKKLGEVKAATEQAWGGLREGMDKALLELKKSYESTIGFFK